MKKTLIILAACLLVGTASAQDLSCKDTLLQSDTYVPSLCGSGDNSGGVHLKEDSLTPLQGVEVLDAKVTHLTWDDAKKICERHVSFIVADNFAGLDGVHYADGFEEMCREVDVHFESEAQRAKDIVDQADLNDLRQFLEISK